MALDKETTIETIKNIMRCLNGFSGAALIGGTYLADYERVAVHLQFKSRSKNRANKVVVTYNETYDLFDMSFWSVRGATLKKISAFNQVFIGDLRSIFEEETGLYLNIT